MDYTSLPPYLDPANWHQQPNHQQGCNIEINPQLSAPSTGPVRPNSMADKARMAKIPQPDIALKCPRCESINTKFCYFNNYSLSQPRHFCKTCRRYWTRGGALRSVPVGGGCRRNKRGKNPSSKSQGNSADPQKGLGSTSSTPSSNSLTTDFMTQNHQPELPFMTSLPHFTDYGGVSEMGLNFTGMRPVGMPTTTHMDFQMGNNFQFMTGLEQPVGLYPYASEGIELSSFTTGAKAPTTTSLLSQMGSVKMEESHHQHQQGLNLSRQILGIPGNDQQYWGGNNNNAWSTDLSGFASSSTGHLL
ncbi:hypothetical protein GIB67_040453 [Kingdonia uniflora]|uniref:Dof zinc finger protein n=1 Tax=Kingdonia uniflora TaxID=39325 RepID=A0A7J7L539_9MAGN|nr:hypothetical protein GIB67_040453 [Kingdonia uniflora]